VTLWTTRKLCCRNLLIYSIRYSDKVLGRKYLNVDDGLLALVYVIVVELACVLLLSDVVDSWSYDFVQDSWKLC